MRTKTRSPGSGTRTKPARGLVRVCFPAFIRLVRLGEYTMGVAPFVYSVYERGYPHRIPPYRYCATPYQPIPSAFQPSLTRASFSAFFVV